MTVEAPVEQHSRPRTPLPLFVIRTLAVAAALGVVGYFGLGMPGMDHGGTADPEAMGAMDHGSVYAALSPVEFQQASAAGAAFVANVDPDAEVLLEGTDADLPNPQLAPAELPADKATPIFIYGKNGAVAREAAGTFISLGYSNVSYLAGGTAAWTLAGLPVAAPRQ